MDTILIELLKKAGGISGTELVGMFIFFLCLAVFIVGIGYMIAYRNEPSSNDD